MLVHKIGALVDGTTGDVIDAGVILHDPHAGTVVLHGADESDLRPVTYDPERFPRLAVIPFEYNLN